MNLTLDQVKRLRTALKAMCPDRDGVTELVFEAFGTDLDDFTTSTGGVGALLVDVVSKVQPMLSGVGKLIDAAIDILENGPVPQVLPDTHPLKQLRSELGDQIWTENEEPLRAYWLLGDRVLLDRLGLRATLETLKRDDSGKHILVVQGKRRSGRSHSEQLIRLLGNRAGFNIIYADLNQLANTHKDEPDGLRPEHLGESIATQMGRPEAAVRQGQTDAAWAEGFCNRLTPFIQETQKQYWIVLDSFDKQLLPQGIYDLIDEMATRIEHTWPQLRLVLLSYDKGRLLAKLQGAQGLETEELAAPIGENELNDFFIRVYEERKQRRQVEYTPVEVADKVKKVLQAVDPQSENYLEELSNKVIEEARPIRVGGGAS
jgi:hypothetical protein